MLTRCYEVTLNAQNLRECRDFYANVLGFELLREREGISFTVDTEGTLLTFELFYKKPDSWATLRFETEDVPHFCARLRAAGHALRREWADKAELVDPDGRVILVTQRLL